MSSSIVGEASSLLVELEDILKPIDLSGLFPEGLPLELELGSGDGSFLLNWAEANPERNYLGVERLLGRVRKIDRKGRRRGLTNIRGVRVECAYLLEYLLPAKSIDWVHVYFPDPWPKRKHWNRRLINECFPALVKKVLKPQGVVYLRTDNGEYFEQMLNVFSQATDFIPTETPARLVKFKTDFEDYFNEQGVPTNVAAFALIDKGQS